MGGVRYMATFASLLLAACGGAVSPDDEDLSIDQPRPDLSQTESFDLSVPDLSRPDLSLPVFDLAGIDLPPFDLTPLSSADLASAPVGFTLFAQDSARGDCENLIACDRLDPTNLARCI